MSPYVAVSYVSLRAQAEHGASRAAAGCTCTGSGRHVIVRCCILWRCLILRSAFTCLSHDVTCWGQERRLTDLESRPEGPDVSQARMFWKSSICELHRSTSCDSSWAMTWSMVQLHDPRDRCYQKMQTQRQFGAAIVGRVSQLVVASHHILLSGCGCWTCRRSRHARRCGAKGRRWMDHDEPQCSVLPRGTLEPRRDGEEVRTCCCMLLGRISRRCCCVGAPWIGRATGARAPFRNMTAFASEDFSRF